MVNETIDREVKAWDKFASIMYQDDRILFDKMNDRNQTISSIVFSIKTQHGRGAYIDLDFPATKDH